MSGEHKLWTIPKDKLKSFQHALRPAAWPRPSPSLEVATQAVAVAGGHADIADIEDAEEEEEEKPPTAAPPVKEETAAEAPEQTADLELWPEGRMVAPPVPELRVGGELVWLQDGLCVLSGALSLPVQQAIVDACHVAAAEPGGWFQERFASGAHARCTRMCLGQHWNAVTKKWEKVRGNIDGLPVPPMPDFLPKLYDLVVKQCNVELAAARRGYAPFPNATPDICIVNFYTDSGRLNIHQDRSETRASLEAGYPVIGLCVGDACLFDFCNEAPDRSAGHAVLAAAKPKSVRLQSGDVVLFGGKSRLVWHGISRVFPRTAPAELQMTPGRLSITMRKN